MLKRIVLSFFVAMCVLTLGSSVREARAAAGKIEVCHVPPGDPAGAMTISVGSQAALTAHLAHGDTKGACNSGQACQDQCNTSYVDAQASCNSIYDPAGNCAPDDTACINDFSGLLAGCIADAQVNLQTCQSSCPP